MEITDLEHRVTMMKCTRPTPSNIPDGVGTLPDNLSMNAVHLV